MSTLKFAVAVIRALGWLAVSNVTRPLSRRTCQEWFGLCPTQRFYDAVRDLG